MTKPTHIMPDLEAATVSNGYGQDFRESELHLTKPQPQWPPKELMDSVRLQVESELHVLEPGASYTLRRICGKAFWRPLTTWERIVAGQCMAYMICKKQLPLTHAGHTSANALLYQLN